MSRHSLVLALLLLLVIESAQSCNILQTSSYVTAFQSFSTCVSPQVPAKLDLSVFTTFIGGTLDLSPQTCADLSSCAAILTTFAEAQSTTNEEMKDLATKLTLPGSQIPTCNCLKTYSAQLDGCSSIVDEMSNQFCTRFFPAAQGVESTAAAAATKPPTASSSSSSSVAAPSCDAAITTLCHFDAMPSFNETISCVKNNLVALETKCELLLDVFIAGIFRSCATDIVTKCQTSFSINSPAKTMACLAWNYQTLTATCRGQLEDLAGNVLPCGQESALYCSDKYLPEDVFLCLSTVSKSNLSPICSDMVNGFSQCKDTIDELLPSPGAPGDGGAGGDQNGDGDGSEGESKPRPSGGGGGGGKNKPQPGGGDGGGRDKSPDSPPRRRGLQSDDSSSEKRPKSKPRPGQNGAGTKPKPHPGAGNGNGGGDGGGEGGGGKLKPSPGDGGGGGGGGKLKPSPGNGGNGSGGNGGDGVAAKKRPCWQRNGSGKGGKARNEDNDKSGADGPIGGNGQGTNGNQGGNSASYAPQNDDAPSPGRLFPIVVLLLCALLAAVFAYRARAKIHEALARLGLVSAASEQTSNPSQGTSVEMLTYTRAPAEETDIDSSSHPLSLSKEDQSAVSVIAESEVFNQDELAAVPAEAHTVGASL